jgi:hypothetical protein
MSKRSFNSLTVPEILALAISLEEEDAHIYGEFARQLETKINRRLNVLERCREMKKNIKRRLTEMLFAKSKNPTFYPKRRCDGICRTQTAAISRRKSLLPGMKRTALRMELETEMFYLRAAARADDPEVRMLLTELANVERHTKAKPLAAAVLKTIRLESQKQRKSYFCFR